MISRNGRAVVGFGSTWPSYGTDDRRSLGLGFGKPGDWYYTRIVYPDDVRAAKRRVDAKYQSVNHDVNGCTALTKDENATWTALFVAWRKLYCLSDKPCVEPDVSIFGLGGQMDDVERYEKSAYDWQLKLQAKTCEPSAPIEKPEVLKREDSDKRADEHSTLNTTVGAVKVIAVVGAIGVAVVYLVPQIAKLVPERSK